MRTLRDFWNSFTGTVDFFSKAGKSIDDMDYPLETEVLEEKKISEDYWRVVLNV